MRTRWQAAATALLLVLPLTFINVVKSDRMVAPGLTNKDTHRMPRDDRILFPGEAPGRTPGSLVSNRNMEDKISSTTFSDYAEYDYDYDYTDDLPPLDNNSLPIVENFDEVIVANIL